MATCSPPSFFKILLDPSAPHLPLPPDFVTKHLVNKIPKDSVVRSANGEYSWRLKITKIGDSYCFSDGWNNVARDTQLRFGDFLIFQLVDQSTFKVSIYSPNGCEKDLPSKMKVEDDDAVIVNDVPSKIKVEDDAVIVNDDLHVQVVADHDVEEEQEEEDYNDEEEESEEEDDDDDEEDDEDVDEYEEQIEYGDDDDIEDEDEDEEDGGGDIDGHDGDPFFTSIIAKTHRSLLRLPEEFVRLAGIDVGETLTLKNLDGEEWETIMRLEKLFQRYYVTSGWPDFRQSNDLLEGDECVFKFLRGEGKLLLARVTRKKRRARDLRPSDGTPATVKSNRRQPQPQPRTNGGVQETETVKRKGRPPQPQPQPRTDGGVQETEAVKRKGRPPQPQPQRQPRTDGGVQETETVKRKGRQSQPRTDGGVPATEGVKRKRGPQAGIEDGATASEAVKKKKGRPQPQPPPRTRPARGVPPTEVVKRRTRGQGGGTVAKSKDDGGVEVVNRPRGRPAKPPRRTQRRGR